MTGMGRAGAVVCGMLVLAWMVSARGAGAEGLVAEWGFEGDGGEVVKDTSGRGNNGALKNGAARVEDGIGTALKFDGVDDYVECGGAGSLDIGREITLEAWVYPIKVASGVGEPLIVGKGLYSYALAYNPGQIWFYISDGGWHCVAEIPTRKWTHVVGTYDGKKMKLYVNGEFRTAYSMADPGTPIKHSDGGVLLGKRGDAYFCGMVDNVRIYDRPLTKEEVMAHYASEKKLVKRPPPVRREDLKGLALKVFDIGKKRRTLRVNAKERVSENLTIPSNVTLRFEDEGVCEIEAGATLTINGPVQAVGSRIFSGAGRVVFGHGYVEAVYPQWWGAKADDSGDDTAAIQAAIDSHPTGGMVRFPRGRYEISSRIVVRSGIVLDGPLTGAQIHAKKPLPAMLQRPDLTPPPKGIHFNAATRVDGVRISNLHFKGEGSAIGLDLTNINYTWVENVAVTDCGTGIMLAQLGMYETFINPVIARCETGMEFNIGTMDSNIFGGRISVVKTGILINNTGQLNIYGITFDAFKETGLEIKTGGHMNLHNAWFDSVAPAVPVRIGPRVSGCTVVNPRFSGPTPKIIDDRSKGEGVVIVNTSGDARSTLRARIVEGDAIYTKGISAGEKRGGNLRGEVTISGDKKEAFVRFSVAEPDGEYFTTATVVSVKGDAPAGARNVHITDKSKDGFTVRLQEAPGKGNSVGIDWILVR